MMLLIILLGVITKMALVSADCHIDTTNKTIDWTNASVSDTSLDIFNVYVTK
jgi:hypothetical protein